MLTSECRRTTPLHLWVDSMEQTATHNSDPDKNEVKTCIFCLIANNRDEETKILKQNEHVVCFRDIYPAAPHHYLVVPRQHITNCHSLHRGHIDLVEQMVELGKATLIDQGITDMTDISLGFHQPPYTSVDHLHLHVLAPASKISEYMEYKFHPGSYRFLTVERLRKQLQHICSPLSSCCIKV
ncbi:adenosine 5'-monophosphoramidase HINT3-like [Mugil cephalus]|uniref:adenosine 5'-monophosphoramidase HINT3-like n=1 Tax=Mugil cephalus TaxID=48193 RepID=UPI001FB60A60|nr:adenosine 5'-monophosphoramidase HINT3-like [Mugil cephalus]